MPDEADPIPATLVIAPDGPQERSAPIYDWLPDADVPAQECARAHCRIHRRGRKYPHARRICIDGELIKQCAAGR